MEKGDKVITSQHPVASLINFKNGRQTKISTDTFDISASIGGVGA